MRETPNKTDALVRHLPPELREAAENFLRDWDAAAEDEPVDDPNPEARHGDLVQFIAEWEDRNRKWDDGLTAPPFPESSSQQPTEK